MTDLVQLTVVLVVFFSSYFWNSRRGLWLPLSRVDWPRETYFMVWYTPGFWSLISLVLIVTQIISQIALGIETPSWLWALTLGGATGFIDSLINP